MLVLERVINISKVCDYLCTLYKHVFIFSNRNSECKFPLENILNW